MLILSKSKMQNDEIYTQYAAHQLVLTNYNLECSKTERINIAISGPLSWMLLHQDYIRYAYSL